MKKKCFFDLEGWHLLKRNQQKHRIKNLSTWPFGHRDARERYEQNALSYLIASYLIKENKWNNQWQMKKDEVHNQQQTKKKRKVQEKKKNHTCTKHHGCQCDSLQNNASFLAK